MIEMNIKSSGYIYIYIFKKKYIYIYIYIYIFLYLFFLMHKGHCTNSKTYLNPSLDHLFPQLAPYFNVCPMIDCNTGC